MPLSPRRRTVAAPDVPCTVPPGPGRLRPVERVLAALNRWGREAFTALFGDRDGGGKLEAAVREGYAALRLQVRSDDPAVLAWPWEALHDPQAGPLGQVSQVERRLDAIGDPPALDPRLPQHRLHILLVTARPYARDVAYRSISRPLVDLIASRKLPAEIHLLRPPTFERLREHLREKPRHYHILHFDGHGAYGLAADPAADLARAGRAHTFSAPQGCLGPGRDDARFLCCHGGAGTVGAAPPRAWSQERSGGWS